MNYQNKSDEQACKGCIDIDQCDWTPCKPQLNKDCKIADKLNSDHTKWVKTYLNSKLLELMKYEFFDSFKETYPLFLCGSFDINDVRNDCRLAISEYIELSDAELDECIQFVSAHLLRIPNMPQDELKAMIQDIPLPWNEHL
jgi:hypothetical protein